MKKKYIKPIIEYEELDNDFSFLTNSRTQGWAEYDENGNLIDQHDVHQGGDDDDDDGWGDLIID